MRPRPTAPARSRWSWLRARFGRFTATVLSAMQALCVVMSVQVSGLAHVAADAFDRITCASADCDHERAGDDRDDECPPGCPTCHACAHPQVPYTPRGVYVPAAPVLLVVHRDRGDATAPPSRFLPSVFRPPRASRFAHT